ncbi:hypothetical protein NQ268_25160, partial [Escherichia coli]|nr:hypothetical protein [Escherichia coli]
MDPAQFLLDGRKINTKAPACLGDGATIDHKPIDQRRIAAREQQIERIGVENLIAFEAVEIDAD